MKRKITNLKDSGEYFQLVSERGRERVVVGRQATVHVVSRDRADSSSHSLQSSETLYPIDAGSTVTCLVHGQELVDSMKPALVHEDRPIVDPCLGRHSSFGSCDHHRQTWEQYHKRWDKILLNASSSDERTYVTGKMTTNAATWRCLRRVSCDAILSQAGAGIACWCVSCRHSFRHWWNVRSFLDLDRLNDGQRSIAAARSCEPWRCRIPWAKQVLEYATQAPSISTSPHTFSFTHPKNVPTAV